MTRLLHSIPLLYVALILPGYLSIWGLFDTSWYIPQMLHESGIWATQLLILTLAVTPVLLVIKRLGRGKALGRWLLPRRRHFGLASFLFATVHVLHYIRLSGSFTQVLEEAVVLEYLLGWAAFLVFVALALTSNNASTRMMGRGWKRLHLWVYPATAVTFFHWYLFEFFSQEVGFWALVFVILKSAQITLRHVSNRARRISAAPLSPALKAE